MKKPELLCPVGGRDTLEAALLGGADAVYFGAKDFNARRYAKNFSREEIPEAVARCHERGVKVYVTLNTLLTDRNLSPALELVSFLYEAGCDALILADIGFSSLLSGRFPSLELHGSTQMSGHSVGAAEYLRDMGFSRMVLAREMDRENLRDLCERSPIETEIFVHGALCASASGQCLMSSMIGDRSGNRGECAQPCRLPYNSSFPLSLKDLCLARHVKEILSLGVSSLKIEGRMKSPEYVYTVSRVWRRLLDEERDAKPEEIASLAGVFSRSGFTDGYFVKRVDSGMLGTRTEADKKRTSQRKVSFSDSGRRADPIVRHREAPSFQPLELPAKTKPRFHRSARFLHPGQIPETDFFHEIYLPLEEFNGEKANGVVLPAVIFPEEEKTVLSLLRKAKENGARHVLVGNTGHLCLVRDMGFQLHGDFRLNVTNSFSLAAFPELCDVIVSPELNCAQIRDLKGEKSVIVYGYLPLMLLEKDPGAKTLRDRRGVRFSVARDGGRYAVLNSVPFYMADRKKLLQEKGIENTHFLFTVETKDEAAKVIEAYKKGLPPKGAVKRIK